MRLALYDWEAPTGREPAPVRLHEARTAFERAMAAYEAGREREAAEGFIAATGLLPQEAPPGIRRTILLNAALAFEAAGDVAAARRAREAARGA